MRKSPLTLEIESLLQQYHWKIMMEHDLDFSTYCMKTEVTFLSGSEREHTYKYIDAVGYYEKEGKVATTCYEIKVSGGDMSSGYGLNFYGNYNYMVVPHLLKDKAIRKLKEIGRSDVGVIIFTEDYELCIYKESSLSVFYEGKCNTKYLPHLINILYRGKIINKCAIENKEYQYAGYKDELLPKQIHSIIYSGYNRELRDKESYERRERSLLQLRLNAGM